MKTVRQQLHPIQFDFWKSVAPFRLFYGGRNSGKTFIGSFDLLTKLVPGREHGLMAPDYTMLTDIDIPEVVRCGERLQIPVVHHKANMTLEARGALIHCRSLDNPDKVRGHSWRRAWVDEGSIVPREAYDIVLGCLRSEGEQGELSVTFTPKGRNHWTFDVSKLPNVETFHASTRDNPWCPETFVPFLQSQYGSMYARQEIEGEFIDFSGGMFKREWFRIQQEPPAKFDHVCRFWDMASTEKSKSAHDPDYTVGAKIGYAGGVWFVLNVMRGRWSPRVCEQMVRQTAVLDGPYVAVRMEQEAGASGKAMIAHYAANVLMGFDFKGVSPTGSKELRAQPFSAAAEAGNVVLIAGPWNAALLDELEAFSPDCAHDDQCLIAGTLITCERGDVPIEQVTPDDRVWTRCGWRRVISAGQTGNTNKLTVAEFSDGSRLIGTATHRIWLCQDACWIDLDTLHRNDVVYSLKGDMLCQQIQSCTTASNILGIQTQKGRIIRDTFSIMENGKAHQHICTARFGWMLMDLFRRVIRCITGTAIGSTTHWRIWNSCLRANTAESIPFPLPTACLNASQTSDHLRRHGITLQKAVHGTEHMQRPYGKNVEQSNVVQIASPAPLPVFNLRVEECPEFFANGILVHNCDSMSGAFACIRERIHIMPPSLTEHLTNKAVMAYDTQIAELRKGLSPAGQIEADRILREMGNAT